MGSGSREQNRLIQEEGDENSVFEEQASMVDEALPRKEDGEEVLMFPNLNEHRLG